jgi:hypothetical protein
MSIQELGSLGEFVAASGVVVTLIFLTHQTRQNTRAVKNSSALSGMQFWTDFLKPIAHDREVSDLYARGMQSFSALLREEKIRFDLLALTFSKAAETFFRLNQDGSLDPSEWQSWERTIVDVSGRPGFREWWPEREQRFSDEFQRWIGSIPIAEVPAFYAPVPEQS